ncbi:unnamed protein product [Moneuplotes crassus]|uniref:USP domain-containing protein n=1 Tax=Euplotes crassus TaxID=5936 RepID=A0AAD1Y3G6_EUPCR|nr:unnamed protein product [Moneuplotes crassus]
MSKILNLEETKENLLEVKMEDKKSIPKEEDVQKTFTFVKTLLDIILEDNRIVPTNFNIDTYIPIWIFYFSFLKIKKGNKSSSKTQIKCQSNNPPDHPTTLSEQILKNLLSMLKTRFSQILDPQILKSYQKITKSVLDSLIQQKSFQNSAHYYHLIECCYNINDYLFLATTRDLFSEGLSKYTHDHYEFVFNLLAKKFPFTKATYCVQHAMFKFMCQNKMFKILSENGDMVMNSVLSKISKDDTHLELAIDVIAFFTIGFKFCSIKILKRMEDFFSKNILCRVQTDEEGKQQTNAMYIFGLYADYIVLLKAIMIVNSGYPDIYIPLTEKIDQTFGAYIDRKEEKYQINGFIELYTLKLEDLEQEDLEIDNQIDQKDGSESDNGDVEESKVSKKSYKFKGLVNMGNTCYINSFIQALFLTECFRKAIINDLSIGQSWLIADTDSERIIDKLCILFCQLALSGGSSVKPMDLKSSLPESFQNDQQHDSSEFGKEVLSKMDEELKALAKEGQLKYEEKDKTSLFRSTASITSFFNFFVYQTVKCEECNSCSIKKHEEIDFSLSLDLKADFFNLDEEVSVQHLLRNYFLTEELKMKSNNQYFCKSCHKYVNNAKLMKKVSKDLPPIIMVTLNRFDFDNERKEMKKRLDLIKLSPSITVVKEELVNEEEIKEEENKAKDVTYDLYAIVIHSGPSGVEGHYYTIAHDNVNSSGSTVWKRFDDEMVFEVDADFIETINEKPTYNTPYILFYKERELGVRTRDFSEHSKSLFDIKVNNRVPPPLEKFIKSNKNSNSNRRCIRLNEQSNSYFSRFHKRRIFNRDSDHDSEEEEKEENFTTEQFLLNLPKPNPKPYSSKFIYGVLEDTRHPETGKYLIEVKSLEDPEIVFCPYNKSVHSRLPWPRMSTLRIEGFDIPKEFFIKICKSGRKVSNVHFLYCGLIFSLGEALDFTIDDSEDKLDRLYIDLPYLSYWKKSEEYRRGFKEIYLKKLLKKQAERFDDFCSKKVVYIFDRVDEINIPKIKKYISRWYVLPIAEFSLRDRQKVPRNIYKIGLQVLDYEASMKKTGLVQRENKRNFNFWKKRKMLDNITEDNTAYKNNSVRCYSGSESSESSLDSGYY